MKKIIVTGLTFLGFGLVLTIIGIGLGGNQSVAFNGLQPKVINTKVVHQVHQFEQVNQVNLNVNRGKVNFKTGKQFKVSYQGSKDVAPKVTQSGTRVTVSQPRTTNHHVFMDLGLLNHHAMHSQITITLPQKELAKLQITNHDTRISSDAKLMIQALQLDLTDSDFTLSQATVNQLTVNANDTDITFNQSQFKGGNLSVRDGDMTINNSDLQQVKLDNHDGDTYFHQVTATGGEINLTDGDLTAHSLKIKKEYTIKASDGDITITNPQADGYQLQATDGDLHLFNQHSEDGSLSQNPTATNLLTITTSDGDVTVQH